MEHKRRPGYLTQYAAHARISKQAAAEQLKRVGVDYLQPFDFADADRRRAAMRHADRAPYAKPIYVDPAVPPGAEEDDAPDAGSTKDPLFAKSQARKEEFKAKLAELDYVERVGTLVKKDAVERGAFRIGRLVRDAMLNITPRIEGQLAAAMTVADVRKILEAEIRQALDVLASGDMKDPEEA